MKIIGILLIVLGIAGLAYGGITWTTREKVIDLGSVEVTHDKNETLPIPPIAGAVAVVAGAFILLTDRRRRA